ncbi:MAG: hypothetical protein WC815_11305 [Vicinamibacterales bacterium]
MRIRRTVVALFALLLLAPSPGSAQGLPSVEDLALRVNLGDQVRVEDQAGVRTTGRLTRITREEFAIQTEAGERRFTSDTVREVAVRGHSFRRAALVGAGVFAVLGAVAVCSHDGGGDCAILGSLGATPIGAGVGLVMGALIPRMRTVFRAPEGRASVPPSRVAGGAPNSLLENLSLRVNLDDQLRVEDPSGARTTGRLTRLTADEITIDTGAGEKRFTRETVRQIAVRHHPFRMAVLTGAGVGAVAGAIAACTGPAREECADAPIMAGALGAGLGLVAGALVHRTTVVYPEAEQRAFVWPMISRDTVGVRVGLWW